MKNIKAISFDLDHTLYDRNATWDALLPAFKRIFFSELSQNLGTETLCSTLKQADYRATYEETSWRGMYQDLVTQGVISGKSGFPFFNSFIYEFFPAAIVPYEDTYQVLTWCKQKGLRPSVITNGHPGLQERKMAAMKLGPYLETQCICNLDSGVGCKPSPEPFWKISNYLQLPPEEILYVGDNPRNDIMGAKQIGMQTAWLNVMQNWDPQYEPADFEISSLSELIPIINAQTTYTA